MGNALWKDFFREIKKSFSRFISIFTIVFIGVAFFAGIKSTAPDMKYSMDVYYDEYNLMDIRVLSTLGLTTDDIKEISKINGVTDVQPSYFTDAISLIHSKEYVISIHSIPTDSNNKIEKDAINQFKLTQGRYPEKSGECLIEDSAFMDLGIDIGDKVKVSSGKVEEITKSTLATDEFTVVGKGVTPYYLSHEKGSSEIGNGKVNTFMAIMEYDFTMPVYAEALLTVESGKQLNSYSEKYENLVSKVVIPLENMGVDRSAIRLEEVKQIAMEELEKATQEFNEQKALFDEEIAKGEAELNQAQMDLVEGETRLQTEKKNFQANYEQASIQIADGEKQLAAAEIEYANAEKEYNQAMAEHGGDLERLNNVTIELNAQRDKANVQIASLNKQLEDPNLSQEDRESTESLLQQYKSFLAMADEGLSSVNGLNNLGQNQVVGAKNQLNDARKELDTQKAKLAKSKKDLTNGKKQADDKFAASQRSINQGWREYNAGKAEFDIKKVEGQAQIDEGREKIIRAENEIERISKPQWYVLDRNSHLSFVDYGLTADRIDAIAKIFPAFFFLVASLVCITTMTRMIDEQRGVIGAYKALGYSNTSIVLKYILYAGAASILGGVSGILIGTRIFPKVIYNAWSMMYTLPDFKTVRQIPLLIISVVIGILVTTLSAYAACYKELKETPSLLMRPKAPKIGKKIFLEKIDGIWKRLSFSQKVTSRNLFRYKKRFFMTIIGIAGCTALLLAGFGLSDSISQIVSKQYDEIFKYDLNVKYTAIATEEEQSATIDALKKNKNVKSYLEVSQINAKAKGHDEDISATLIIPSDIEKFNDYISLRNRRNQQPIEIPEKGIVINEKLSKELNVKIGDAIELDNGDGARKKVEIAGITENYVFHYAYMSEEYYTEIYRLSPKVNDLMIKLKETSPEEESKLGNLLIKESGVGSVEFYSAVASKFEDTVSILNSIVIVIILSAGILAFVVLYNLTNINIGERIREIATIKVLGFYNNEVSSYVYRENIVLSILGSMAGLLVGIVLHRFIMVSLEQDGIMYGNHIDGISFLYSFFITLIFVIFVNIFMYRRLKNIPMVESLKSVE